MRLAHRYQINIINEMKEMASSMAAKMKAASGKIGNGGSGGNEKWRGVSVK
jgi:hypothetical protein